MDVFDDITVKGDIFDQVAAADAKQQQAASSGRSKQLVGSRPMKPVTDPELLAELNGSGSSGMKRVTDPAIISQLNVADAKLLPAHTPGAVVAPEFKPRTFGEKIKNRVQRDLDPAISLLKGAIAVPEAAVGLADLVTGGKAGKLAESVGFKPGAAKATLNTLYSPEQQAANQAVEESEGFMPTVKAALENPSAVAQTILESAPSFIGGAGVARGVMKALPKVAPLVAGSVGEGLVSAGQTAEQTRQQSKDGELLLKQSAVAAGSGAATGVLGVMGGKLAKRLGIVDIDTLLASGVSNAEKKGIITKAVRGALSEGAFEELPQSAQEQMAQNLATGRPWDEGVADAAAMGILVGSALGGGINAAMPASVGQTVERPNHDSLTGETVIPAAESAKIQTAAPELKPVVKGTPQEILQLKRNGSGFPTFRLDNTTAYLLDPDALQGIYGGSKVEAIRLAKKDLMAGGDKESALLGYPNRQGLKPEETMDAGIDRRGAVIASLPELKAQAEAGNLVWAAEGKPDELLQKAGEVSAVIQQQDGGKGLGTDQLQPEGWFSASGGRADRGGYDLSNKTAIQFPEIVEIAKELTGGNLPRVIKKLRISGALGAFYPGSGDIKLRADIFKTPGLAERVLAHEVGHLADWLPNHTIKRGNILGRIASLKGYMKSLLEEYPNSPNKILTEKDRTRLRKEAADQLKAEARPEETIIETITREVPTWKYIGITPDMVKSIWNDLNARDAYPKLYRAISEMSDAEKKAVMVAAMRGLVHDTLSKFGERVQTGTETITEQVKRTVPGVEVTPEAIAKRYRELLEEEILKRGLYKREQIDEELKNLSIHWKPFKPGNNGYTRYRLSSEELYADALSVLLNDPSLLKKIAPTFERAFFAYIDRKPEVRDAYFAVQRRLQDPRLVQAHRLNEMRGMMDDGDVARQEMNKRLFNEGEKVIDTAMKALVDERFAAKRTIEVIRKLGHGSVADDALRRIEDIPYLASEVSQILYDLDKQIMEPIKSAGIERKDLDVYLFARRILAEETKPAILPDGTVEQVDAHKAAAKGHTPETARQLLVELQRDIGPEKYEAIQQIAKDYREFRESVFLPLFARSGYFTAEQMAMMADRTEYARFQVQKFFEEDPIGTGGYIAKIYERTGSLEDIASPFIETLLQDLSFLRAARVNASKQSFVKVLKAGGTPFIAPAETRFSLDKKAMEPVPPKDRNLAVFSVKENGKWNHYYVAKELAEAFNHEPVVATQMARFWSMVSQPFRELFVSKNPSWLLRNVFRDFIRTVQNVDDARLRDIPSLLKAYGGTFAEVWKFTHDGDRSPQIQGMLAEKSLPVKRTWGSKDETFDDEIARLLANYGMSEKADKQSVFPIRLGKAMWRFADNTAATSDVWGKVAADRWLREHTTKTDAQRITTVRNRIATPNFKNRGTFNPITNSLFMFSNVGVQGLRSSWQSYKANPGSYLWKAFNLHILPKLILGAAAAGYVGDKIKDILDKVPDYDKRLYQVVPLYVDDQGKAHYLRLPDDYEGQWIGSMTWNLMHGDLTGKHSLAGTVGAAVPYNLHPALQIGSAMWDYNVNGNVPVDTFTGMPVMTDDERKAGGKYAAQALGKYAWNKTFSSIYRMESDRVQPDQTTVEKALKTFPLNALGSFYRISDKGDDERIREALAAVQKDQAAAKIERDKAIKALVMGKSLTAEQQMAIAVYGGDIEDLVSKGLVKKWGMKYTSALLNARTPEEKLAIVRLMQDNQK